MIGRLTQPIRNSPPQPISILTPHTATRDPTITSNQELRTIANLDPAKTANQETTITTIQEPATTANQDTTIITIQEPATTANQETNITPYLESNTTINQLHMKTYIYIVWRKSVETLFCSPFPTLMSQKWQKSYKIKYFFH